MTKNHHVAALPPRTRYTTMAAKVLATETDGTTRTVATLPTGEAATAVSGTLNELVARLSLEDLAGVVDDGHAAVDQAGVSHLRQHLLALFDDITRPGADATRLHRAVTDAAAAVSALPGPVVRAVRDEVARLTAALDDVLVPALVYIEGESERRMLLNPALAELGDDDLATLVGLDDIDAGYEPADWWHDQKGRAAAALYRLACEIDCVSDAGEMRYDEDDRLCIDFQLLGQWDDALASGMGALRRWAARHRPHLGTPVTFRYDAEVAVTAHAVVAPGLDPVALARDLNPGPLQVGPVTLDDLTVETAESAESAESAEAGGDPTAQVRLRALAVLEAADACEAERLLAAHLTGARLPAQGPVLLDQVTAEILLRPAR